MSKAADQQRSVALFVLFGNLVTESRFLFLDAVHDKCSAYQIARGKGGTSKFRSSTYRAHRIGAALAVRGDPVAEIRVTSTSPIGRPVPLLGQKQIRAGNEDDQRNLAHGPNFEP